MANKQYICKSKRKLQWEIKIYIELRENCGEKRRWRSFLPLNLWGTHIQLPLLVVHGINGADHPAGATHLENENLRFSSSLHGPCLCCPDNCALCLNYSNASNRFLQSKSLKVHMLVFEPTFLFQKIKYSASWGVSVTTENKKALLRALGQKAEKRRQGVWRKQEGGWLPEVNLTQLGNPRALGEGGKELEKADGPLSILAWPRLFPGSSALAAWRTTGAFCRQHTPSSISLLTSQ